MILEQAVLREWQFFSFLGKPGLLLRKGLMSPVPGMRVLDMPCDPCALEFGRRGPFLSGTLELPLKRDFRDHPASMRYA